MDDETEKLLHDVKDILKRVTEVLEQNKETPKQRPAGYGTQTVKALKEIKLGIHSNIARNKRRIKRCKEGLQKGNTPWTQVELRRMVEESNIDKEFYERELDSFKKGYPDFDWDYLNN